MVEKEVKKHSSDEPDENRNHESALSCHFESGVVFTHSYLNTLTYVLVQVTRPWRNHSLNG